MKINLIRAILIVLLVMLFSSIFGFSNQDGEKSSSLSREITETITKNIKPIQELEVNQRNKVLNTIEHIIRKLAHFSLYTLVGFLTMLLMITYNLPQIKRGAIALTIGALYAITDEIHQSFIPERTALIGDVFIDTAGVIFGLGIAIIFVEIIKCLKLKIYGNKTYKYT